MHEELTASAAEPWAGSFVNAERLECGMHAWDCSSFRLLLAVQQPLTFSASSASRKGAGWGSEESSQRAAEELISGPHPLLHGVVAAVVHAEARDEAVRHSALHEEDLAHSSELRCAHSARPQQDPGVQLPDSEQHSASLSCREPCRLGSRTVAPQAGLLLSASSACERRSGLPCMICEMGSSWHSLLRGCSGTVASAACWPAEDAREVWEVGEASRITGGEDPGSLMRLRAAASLPWAALPERRAKACRACLEDANASAEACAYRSCGAWLLCQSSWAALTSVQQAGLHSARTAVSLLQSPSRALPWGQTMYSCLQTPS